MTKTVPPKPRPTQRQRIDNLIQHVAAALEQFAEYDLTTVVGPYDQPSDDLVVEANVLVRKARRLLEAARETAS